MVPRILNFQGGAGVVDDELAEKAEEKKIGHNGHFKIQPLLTMMVISFTNQQTSIESSDNHHLPYSLESNLLTTFTLNVCKENKNYRQSTKFRHLPGFDPYGEQGFEFHMSPLTFHSCAMLVTET